MAEVLDEDGQGGLMRMDRRLVQVVEVLDDRGA